MRLLPHTSRLTRHALAGAPAAWQRRTAYPHTCCGTCRQDGGKPSDAGRGTGGGTRGACPCEAPHVLRPCSRPGSPELGGWPSVRTVAGLRLCDSHGQHARL